MLFLPVLGVALLMDLMSACGDECVEFVLFEDALGDEIGEVDIG